MTKNFTFYTTLLSLLISLLPAFSFAQNKLQMYQISGNTTSYTSSNVPYILIGKVFFPTSKKSFSFQNVNTTFETVFPKKRVVKMSYSGGMEKEEVEAEYSSTTVLYKNVYENIDIQVAGRDENAIFSLTVRPYGKLEDMFFK